MKNEINISHVHIETPIILSENYVQLLVVENPNEFYEVVTDLNNSFDGVDGKFVFSIKGQIISPEKYGAIISNIFNFDLNDKKLLTLLQKKLEAVAFSEKLQLFNELSSKTISFLSEVSFYVPFAIDFNEPQPLDYFKISNLKFEKSYDSLEEKIICYINALIELKNCDFFIFVNLKSVLSDEKLQQIYNHCLSEKVALLLIESEKRRDVLPYEKAIIITEDLCEILENYN